MSLNNEKRLTTDEKINPYEKPMVETLKRAVSILDSRNIDYWIDCGTLLGLVRDDKIIPWDEDVELGAWLTDRESIEHCTNEFIENGLIVTVSKPDKIGLQLPDNLPYKFRILFYDKRNGNAGRGSYGAVSLPGRIIDNLKNLPSLISKSENIKTGEKVGTINSLIKLFVLMCSKFPKSWISSFSNLFSKIDVKKRYYWEIPVRFFENTYKTDFYGVQVTVPIDSEKYLAFRYGQDWKNPTRFWVDRASQSKKIRHK